MKKFKRLNKLTPFCLAFLSMGLFSNNVSATTFHNGSGSIIGSVCVGFDCTNSENFSFDTLRLKENNLRMHFDDTSNSASFPDNDWRIIANDSSNGGAEHFTIEDATSGNDVFRVFAGARNNALVVDSQGDVGIGTTTPAVDIDVKTGNTPTMRLQQDGTSGFTPQTWDMAGNETNFFIRDATNGSQLPFRIEPGADTNSLVIDENNSIGMGTNAPDESLHVRRTDAKILVEDTNPSLSNTRIQLELSNNGASQFKLLNSSVAGTGNDWRFQNYQGNFRATAAGTGQAEMTLDTSGNVTFLGTVSANNGANTLPDYVFEPNYKLMPLEKLRNYIRINKHLPNVISKDDLKKNGNVVNMTHLQYKLLEKVEELTLYTLNQQEELDTKKQTLNKQTLLIKDQRQQLDKQHQRISKLESMILKLSDSLGE